MDKKYKITKTLIDDINKRLSFGLISGLGVQEDGKMCVEAVICAAFGLPHSDNPPCVGKNVRKAKIALNDCNWSSAINRSKGMSKLAVAQLGSEKLNQKDFDKRLLHKSCQNILPLLINGQIADKTQSHVVPSLQEWKNKFKESTAENIDILWKEFYYNNNNTYNYNYYNYHYNYNYYNYHYNYNYYSKDDKFLLIVANTILSVLVDMNCEGCKWL